MPSNIDISTSKNDLAPPDPQTAAWPAVFSLSLGVFSIITAEFMPVSLLTPMAGSFGVSNGLVGQSMTVTAAVAALAGPLLVLGSGRLDRRTIMRVLMLMLVVSSVMTAFANSIEVLFVARAILGVTLGGYWAMMMALAIRLVPPDKVPKAISTIIMGVSVGTVIAAPLGAALGDFWGWRNTFLAAAALGAVSFLFQMAVLPSLPPTGAPPLGAFRTALSRRTVLIGFVTVIIVTSGHFAGFTFIRPFLEDVPQLDISAISMTLLAFGIGGLFGNPLAGMLAARSPAWATGGTALLIGAVTIVLALFGGNPTVALLGTAVWGFAFGGFPVSVTIWNARAAPDVAEIAGALLTSSFQVAIAGGALIGGLLIDRIGATGVIVYAAVASIVGAGVMLSLGLAAERRIRAGTTA